MNRQYIRCTYCERPMSVNSERKDIEFYLNQNCPLCGENALRYMGQVQQTNIVRQRVKAACDKRCTLAVGPKCDCPCINANHGTHRLVVFNEVVGKLEVVERDLLNNNEAYLSRIKRMAATKNKIKVNVITFLNYKYRDVIVAVKQHGYNHATWNSYDVYCKILRRIDKIEDMQSIQKKINSLTGLIKKIGDNLEYIEAIFGKKQEVKV